MCGCTARISWMSAVTSWAPTSAAQRAVPVVAQLRGSHAVQMQTARAQAERGHAQRNAGAGGPRGGPGQVGDAEEQQVGDRGMRSSWRG